MPPPITIQRPKQLLVEGKTAELFFQAILRDLAIADVQLQNYGGITDLAVFLLAFRNQAGFPSVGRLAIARDAEASCASAFQSVGSALRHAALPEPKQLLQIETGPPDVLVYLFPNCSDAGMLEDLCWQSVGNDPAVPCISDFFDCLTRNNLTHPTPLAKAQIQAFLASRPDLGLLLGQACLRGVFDWRLQAFDPLKHFLHSL
jgi:hypothetical protein